MKSELWQRLRAARRYADLRQLDVAKACNVSRPAVAQWEAAEEEKRTRPSIKEIQALSKLAKLPVEWLLNDNADPADVWQVGRMANTPDPMPVRKTLPLPPAFESRMGEAFRRAIEFYVLQQRPDLAPGFATRSAPSRPRSSGTTGFSLTSTLVQMILPPHLARSSLPSGLLGRLQRGRFCCT